jgi:hypothetical protein
MHLVRYFGIFAPRARLRDKVAPPAASQERTDDGCEQSHHKQGASDDANDRTRQRRMTWAQLLKRVFEIDVMECPRCHARMQHVSVVTDPSVIRRMLECMSRAQAP